MTTKTEDVWRITENSDRNWTLEDLNGSGGSYTVTNVGNRIPSGITLASPSGPGALPHYYVSKVNVGSATQYGSTASAGLSRVRGNLREEAGPLEWGQSGDVEVSTGTKSDLFDTIDIADPFPLIKENTVEHIVSDDGAWIINIAQEDHNLHMGVVARSAYIEDGDIIIVTIGWGNGQYPIINELAAETIIWPWNGHEIARESKE
jgi:hypothetical protein